MAEESESRQSVTGEGLRLIADVVRPHPVPFGISLAGSLVYALATVMTAEVLGMLTDRVVFATFEQGRLPDDWFLLGPLALMAVITVRSAGVVARRFFAGMTSERVQSSFHRRLLTQYLALPLSWHQRQPTGELLAHVDSDTEKLAEPLHPLPLSIGAVALTVFSAVSLLLVDLVLAVVAFVIFPVMFLLNRVYSRRIEAPAAAVQEGVGATSAVAHESFDGALIVKTLGRAGPENRRFAAAATRLRDSQIQVGYLRALFEACLDAIPSMGVILVVLIGAVRLDAGAITKGDLVQVSVLFTILAFPMRVFGYFLEGVPPAVVAHRRLAGVLDEPLPNDPTDMPALLSDGPLGLAVEDLAFAYNGQEAVLDGVSFEVAPGEVVALVGSTGSGKSTLAMLLAGLVPPSHGEVRLGGIPVDQWAPGRRSSATALVFQEAFLFGSSVAANIDVDSVATHDEVVAAASVAQIDEFLKTLPMGYDTIVGERGVTLSGGQRQRVALARALVRQPRFLILDDATSAVDPKVERQILDGLRLGLTTTTLIVAQRVATIKLADRVLYLADGHIVGHGPHEQLMEMPGYRSLVTAYEEGVT